MVKNKALPDSARLCTPRLVTLSLSLPRRFGPVKAGLTCLCLLSLSPTLFILRVPPGSCWGWTPAWPYTASEFGKCLKEMCYVLEALSVPFCSSSVMRVLSSTGFSGPLCRGNAWILSLLLKPSQQTLPRECLLQTVSSRPWFYFRILGPFIIFPSAIL